MSDWIAPEDYESIVLDLTNEVKANIESGNYSTIMAIKMDVKTVCQNHWATINFKRALQVLMHSGNPHKVNLGSGTYGSIADHVVEAAGLAFEHDVLDNLGDLSKLFPQLICTDCEKTVPHVNDAKRCEKCAKTFDLDHHWGIWFVGNPASPEAADHPGWCKEYGKPQFFMFQSEAQTAMDDYWTPGADFPGAYKVALRLPSGDHAFIENAPKPGLTIKQIIEEKLGQSAPTQAENMITSIIAEIDAETQADKLVEDSLAIFD